jgi:hypothetical protein
MTWPTFTPLRRFWPLGAVALVVVLMAIVSQRWADDLEPRLRAELEAWLSDRLGSDVSVEAVEVQLGPRLHVTGERLVVRIRRRPDLPPLVTIGRWSGTAHLEKLRIRHFDELRLEDVRITIPPRRLEDMRPPETRGGPPRRPPAMRIDRLVADRVLLGVLPRDDTRDPLLWDIRDLRMDPFSFDAASPFSATVDTPLPDDRAHVTGTAGPWPRGRLHDLPLSGEYVLRGRLDRVPGLHGAIVVRGHALGTLDRLSTVGDATSTSAGLAFPDSAGLPFHARYRALFDATSADVHIERMSVTAGRATVQAEGHVVRARGASGRHIDLHVTASRAEVGDVLRSLIGGAAPATGRVNLDARLDLPPGDADVIDRARLDVRFDLMDARFLAPGVQRALDEMARRGRGQPGGDDGSHAPVRVRGRATLADARVSFTPVDLGVPGASVAGTGWYRLRPGTLGFHGVARLDAKLARTQQGWKRWLLWPVSPLLAKDGAGTRLVLDVRGTRAAPQVDIDLGASLRGRR